MNISLRPWIHCKRLTFSEEHCSYPIGRNKSENTINKNKRINLPGRTIACLGCWPMMMSLFL